MTWQAFTSLDSIGRHMQAIRQKDDTEDVLRRKVAEMGL